MVTTLNNLTSIYSHTLYANSAYYEASSPVYALHLTGFGCEVGGALLPPIVCTGSQEVAFIRSTNEFIGLKILVPAGGEDDFEFNGNPALINANQFSNVPGTDGEWKYANITASSFVPQLSASRLYNSTSNFHLGIINGGASSGTRYGYFSNYAAQAYIVQVDDNTLCEGDELELESNLLLEPLTIGRDRTGSPGKAILSRLAKSGWAMPGNTLSPALSVRVQSKMTP